MQQQREVVGRLAAQGLPKHPHQVLVDGWGGLEGGRGREKEREEEGGRGRKREREGEGGRGREKEREEREGEGGREKEREGEGGRVKGQHAR